MAAIAKQQLSSFGIGASEISAVAGLNPYASPWDIYLRKTGQAPDIEPTEPMEWGNRLEPAIRQKYCDDTGELVHVPITSLFHADYPWARATPDGIALAKEHGWKHLLQCKNVGSWVEKAWSEAPPSYVQLQEQWEMLVTGLSRADVAVLIGGNDFRIYTVHRDDKIITDLLTIAGEFWMRVETKTPPPIDESEACQKHFESRFAKGSTVELIADGETEMLMSTWHELTKTQKATETVIKRIRNEVRSRLADAQAGSLVSTIGIAKLITSAPEPKVETDWKLVAQMLGSVIGGEEYDEIVRANTKTTTTEPKQTLYAPKNWAKESK
jgi:putative phage-type endonuclease